MDTSSLPAAGADAGGENQGQSAQVPAASGQDTVVTVIHDDEETGERGKDQAQHKRIMPMKRPNLDVRAEFDLETKGEGKTEVKCKHCKVIVQTAKTVNPMRPNTMRKWLIVLAVEPTFRSLSGSGSLPSTVTSFGLSESTRPLFHGMCGPPSASTLTAPARVYRSA